jgi:hypothetical protein
MLREPVRETLRKLEKRKKKEKEKEKKRKRRPTKVSMRQ